MHLVASKLGLPICRLLPAMHAISRCDSITSFSHTAKITTFQTLRNKLDELTDMIELGEFPSLSLETPSAVTSIQYVCYLYDENKSGSIVNELRYQTFRSRGCGHGGRLPTPSQSFLIMCPFLRKAL